jgi:hypothetical protein
MSLLADSRLEELHGDALAEERVLAEVDDPHPAGPELLDDAMAPQALADHELMTDGFSTP